MPEGAFRTSLVSKMKSIGNGVGRLAQGSHRVLAKLEYAQWSPITESLTRDVIPSGEDIHGWTRLARVVIVLVIIMIIFGAGKLPEIAKSLGQGVKEFREEAQAPVVPASTSTTATTTDTTLRAEADRVQVAGDETAAETVRVGEVPTGVTSRDAI